VDLTGKLLWKYRTGGVVRGVALSENGEYLVATSHDRYLYFFEKSGKLLWISKVAPEIWTLSSSGMCDTIVVGCRDRTVRLLENKEMVKLQLEAARTVISSAEEEGADVSEPYKLLKKADSASDGGKLEESLSLAGRAKASAEEALDKKLKKELDDKLAAFEKKIAEIKEARKSPARVEWALQRAKKLMEAGRLKRAVESARKSEAALEGMPVEEVPKPKKPVKPEGEKPTKPAAEDKRKGQLENDLNAAIAEISEIEKSGADVGEAEALLEKASGALGRGDYDVATEFIQSARKQAQGIMKHRPDASDTLAEAETAVSEAGKAGVDITELSTNLKMAKDSMEAGEFELAVDYANQVITAAKEAKEKAEAAAKPPGKEPGVTKPAATGADSAPKCPNCGKKVKPQWKSCPFCRTRLK
jgi:tetratricopeptide (TPR) repeat protein